MSGSKLTQLTTPAKTSVGSDNSINNNVKNSFSVSNNNKATTRAEPPAAAATTTAAADASKSGSRLSVKPEEVSVSPKTSP